MKDELKKDCCGFCWVKRGVAITIHAKKDGHCTQCGDVWMDALKYEYLIKKHLEKSRGIMTINVSKINECLEFLANHYGVNRDDCFKLKPSGSTWTKESICRDITLALSSWNEDLTKSQIGDIFGIHQVSVANSASKIKGKMKNEKNRKMIENISKKIWGKESINNLPKSEN